MVNFTDVLITHTVRDHEGMDQKATVPPVDIGILVIVYITPDVGNFMSTTMSRFNL